MLSDRTVRKPELLAPAGSPEVLRVAVHYGADAVYIGGEAFGLRAKAKNFPRKRWRSPFPGHTHAEEKSM